MLPADVILKRFESPDEVRDMVKGRFELVRIGGMTIGRVEPLDLARAARHSDRQDGPPPRWRRR